MKNTYMGLLKDSWNDLSANLFFYIWGSMVVALASVFSLGILYSPLMAGYIRAIKERKSGNETTTGDIFKYGFERFGASFLSWLLINIASLVISFFFVAFPVLTWDKMSFAPATFNWGLWIIYCLILLVYIIVISMFFMMTVFVPYIIAVKSDVTAIEAIRESIRLCLDNFWDSMWVITIAALVSYSGNFFCGVGALITAPLWQIMILGCYEDFISFSDQPEDHQ